MKLLKLLFTLFLITAASFHIQAERIITLAPALTEIVFALGKGGNLVGNTKFCNFPGEATKITRVGGLLDVNLEIIVGLKPDVIILYPESYEKIKIMEKRAKLVIVKHTNLEDIFVAINVISRVLAIEKEGDQLIAGMKHRLDNIKQKTGLEKKVKVLLIIGRNPDTLSNMYIIGAGDFLNELMAVAGGENAYQGNISYPGISVESVIAMNPDVIIELSAFNEGIKEENVLSLWQKFPFISAVKNKKITIIKDDLWLIPGPRVPLIAEKMYSLFHQDL
ncbi:MAG: helical backbone metal receptor [Acidobacteria bacterium]|jgi:iron complex transport system substrate-binding protein|nr:helical backbone metal receptor [Acidobacteriota bacterium]